MTKFQQKDTLHQKSKELYTELNTAPIMTTSQQSQQQNNESFLIKIGTNSSVNNKPLNTHLRHGSQGKGNHSPPSNAVLIISIPFAIVICCVFIPTLTPVAIYAKLLSFYVRNFISTRDVYMLCIIFVISLCINYALFLYLSYIQLAWYWFTCVVFILSVFSLRPEPRYAIN